MNLMNDDNNSTENQDDSEREKKIEKRHIPPDITLSHKEAEAGSPCDNSGEEDPGAALEFLITEIDSGDR